MHLIYGVQEGGGGKDEKDKLPQIQFLQNLAFFLVEKVAQRNVLKEVRETERNFSEQ